MVKYYLWGINIKEEDPMISMENLGAKVPFLLLHLFQEEKEEEWAQDD